RLSEVLAAFYRVRRNGWPKWLPPFCSFVASQSEAGGLNAAMLRNGAVMRAFLNDFGRTYFTQTAEKERQLEGACRSWNSGFLPAVDNFIKSGLFPEMNPPLSRIRGRRVTIPGSE